MFRYMGTKHKIGGSLLEQIPSAEHFYDLFGGGGAMSELALTYGEGALFGKKWGQVHYNELKKWVFTLSKAIWTGEFDKAKAGETWVSRAEFNTFRGDWQGDWWGAWVKSAWSFGYKGEQYITSSEKEDLLRSLFVLVKEGMNWHKGSLWEKRYWLITLLNTQQEKYIYGLTGKRFRKEFKPGDRKEYNCEQYHIFHIERLEFIKEFPKADSPPLQMTNGDYRDVEILPNSVVYCDIPYENTERVYHMKERFDREAFLDWAATRDFPVYISEFNINDSRFVEVFKVNRCSRQSRSKDIVTERLYWNGVRSI